MLITYPSSQTEVGQHPKQPQFWRVSSVKLAKKALQQATQLVENHGTFILDTTRDTYIDLRKALTIRRKLLEMLRLGYKIDVMTAYPVWRDWNDTADQCILTIKITFNPHSPLGESLC